MRVLISGVAGYIPSYLTGLLLIGGHEVIGVDNGFTRTMDNLILFACMSNFKFIKGDIGNSDLVKSLQGKYDIAVLCHALVGEPLCNKFPDLACITNTESIQNFLDNSGYPRVIFTSTGSVYGKIEGICNEESKCNPLSLYARSKKLAEEVIQHHGSPYVIYRFATAMGAATSSLRMDLLVNDLTCQAVKNKTLTVFQSEFRRTFCHVRDLAKALYHAITNFEDMKNNIYNVGSKENNWTKRELAECIKTKTGCSVFYGDSGYIDTDGRDYEVDYSKINNTGFNANITVEETIDELIKIIPMLNMANQYNFVG